MENSSSDKETSAEVTGIGGIFFYSDDLQALRTWYREKLGIEVNDWGSHSFQSRNINKPEETEVLQWKPFNKGDAYFSPSKKGFMINYRVRNLEDLVEKLRSSGVVILGNMVTYDYGKFVHVLDLEGNKLELWEPADSE